MDTKTLSRSSPFFSSFADEQLETFFSHLELIKINKGGLILKQGEIGSQLFIIKSGRGEIFVYRPGGERRLIAHTQLSHCYGEASMLGGDVITASIIADEPMECYIFTREQLDFIRVVDPFLALKIEEAIATAVAQKLDNMLTIAHEISQKKKLKESRELFELLPPAGLKREPSIGDGNQRRNYKFFISHNPLFSKLSAKELEQICSYYKIISIPRGTPLQYGATPAIDLVCSGILQLYDPFLPKISFVGPGFLFGQVAFFYRGAEFHAFSRESTTLLRFEKDKIEAMYEENFPLWIKFHTILAAEVAKLLYDVDRLLLRLESEE